MPERREGLSERSDVDGRNHRVRRRLQLRHPHTFVAHRRPSHEHCRHPRRFGGPEVLEAVLQLGALNPARVSSIAQLESARLAGQGSGLGSLILTHTLTVTLKPKPRK